MSDVYDQATDLEMRERDLSLALVRSNAAKPAMLPIGACYNCDECLSDAAALFCNADCRDDFQLRVSRSK